VVVAEAHVVGAGDRVPAFGVVPVEVVRLLGRVLRVGFVDAGELGVVVAAVGGVAVGGLRVAGLVGEGFDVGVWVVAVEGVLIGAVAVVVRQSRKRSLFPELLAKTRKVLLEKTLKTGSDMEPVRSIVERQCNQYAHFIAILLGGNDKKILVAQEFTYYNIMSAKIAGPR
jgi:hypothetical protein